MKILSTSRNIFSGLVLLFLMFLCHLVYALPFIIERKSGTQLPTQISPGSTAYAYFTVSNNTSTTRNANYVKKLPPNVTQITTGGTYSDTCGATFDLGPKGSNNASCTLQLAITGPVNGNAPDPNQHLFVCFPRGKTCAGTPVSFNVVENSWSWTQNNVIGQSSPTFIADIANLDQRVYAGGVQHLSIEGISYFGGELWLSASSSLSWTQQYTTAIPFSKVSSLITNADNTGLFSSSGNNGYAGVNSFIPGATAPTNVGNIGILASSIQDLTLGENNALYAAGATTAYPPIGDVWVWNADANTWISTDFSAEEYGTAFWITYAPDSSIAPGLYVAAAIGFDSSPAIFKYDSPNWTSTALPTSHMTSLQAMNIDNQGSLYAAGSVTNGTTVRGSILKYVGNGDWETIPSPQNSRVLSVIAFSYPANFIYVGGINSAGVGAVWYSSDNGVSWLNTQLPHAASVTALHYNNGTLYAAGSLAGVYGATIWSLVAP